MATYVCVDIQLNNACHVQSACSIHLSSRLSAILVTVTVESAVVATCPIQSPLSQFQLLAIL